MGQEQSINPKLEAEAKKICAVYEQAASTHRFPVYLASTYFLNVRALEIRIKSVPHLSATIVLYVHTCTCNDYSQKAFAAAFKECMTKHTSPDAHAAHAKRLSAADELSDTTIHEELKRQATQVEGKLLGFISLSSAVVRLVACHLNTSSLTIVRMFVDFCDLSRLSLCGHPNKAGFRRNDNPKCLTVYASPLPRLDLTAV